MNHQIPAFVNYGAASRRDQHIFHFRGCFLSALQASNSCQSLSAAKIELSPARFRGKLCAPMQQTNLGMTGADFVALERVEVFTCRGKDRV